MFEFLIVAALVLLLVSPILILVMLYRLAKGQKHQQRLLNSVLARLDRLASGKAPAPTPPPAPQPAAAPADQPSRPAATPPPPPAPAPVPAVAPPPKPVATASPRPERKPPAPPSPLQEKTRRALRRIWNWIAINEEYQPKGVSWEFAVATTWLIRLAVVIFVIGISFFLKYSMDHGFLGPHARVVLSTATGIVMLAFGARLVGKTYHLVGQGLLGGGFAVLYFSTYAAHAFYGLIGALPAFGLMALVTLCAGLFAARFQSLLVAVLGILGGYATPVLLGTGVKNFPGLFGYLLLLGVGVLGISRRRHWPLLNYLAMVLTYGLAALVLQRDYVAADFPVVMPFLAGFFLLFAATMILYNLISAKTATLLEIIGTLANAGIFFALGYGVTTTAYTPRAAAVLALALAAFHVLLVYRFLTQRRQDRGLLMAFFALAAFFAVMVPPLAISADWITAGWALQGLIMLWLAAKLDSRFLRGISLGAYALAIARLAFLDLPRQYATALHTELTWTAYLPFLGARLVAIGTPIAALGAAWFMLRKPPGTAPTLHVGPGNDLSTDTGGRPVRLALGALAILLLFVGLHLEFFRTLSWYYAPLTFPAMSIIWVGLGVFSTLWFLQSRSSAARTLIATFSVAFVAKLLLLDALPWRPDLDRLLFLAPWNPLIAGIRAADAALVIGMLAWMHARLRGHPADKNLALTSGVGALSLLFVFLTFEVNTVLYRFLPGMRAGGLTLLWALYALALLLAGLRRGVRGLRYAGLALFGVAVGKVFLVDLDGLEAIYRIVAFIVLGLVLFTAALLYLRNRNRFLQPDDTPPPGDAS